MDSKEFQITRERSLTRGWLYTISHPDWADLEPSFAVAAAPDPASLQGETAPDSDASLSDAAPNPAASLSDAAPDPVAIRDAIESVINEHTHREITEGFRYDFENGRGPCRVWLSAENQANYASYLKAVELGAESVTLKVEDAEGAVCYAKVPAADYPRFYLAIVQHIQSQIQSGWTQKDSIDYTHLAALATKA